MIQTKNIMPELKSARHRCWALGSLAMLFGIFGYAFRHLDFFIAYLEGFLIVLGLVLGCLGIWMLHALVGGQWGDPIGKITQAAARTLPFVALLFLPILFGMRTLFPWTNHAAMISDAVLAQKLWYLNPQFFIGRAVLFFFLWIVILRGLVNRSPEANNDLSSLGTQRLQNWAGGGVVLLFFTASFAVIDWILSLETYYYSTVWGAMILMGQLLGAFAFVTFMGIWLDQSKIRELNESRIPEQKLNDLGNLILMSIIFWMYMTFSQYLITWSGQIKAEVSWYNAHFMGGWQWFGGALLAFNFALPFVCLLFRPVKRSPRVLAAISGMLLVMQWVYAVWLVAPSFSPMVFSLSWMSLVVPFALISLWLGVVFWNLEKGMPAFARGHREEVAHYAA